MVLTWLRREATVFLPEQAGELLRQKLPAPDSRRLQQVEVVGVGSTGSEAVMGFGEGWMA